MIKNIFICKDARFATKESTAFLIDCTYQVLVFCAIYLVEGCYLNVDKGSK